MAFRDDVNIVADHTEAAYLDAICKKWLKSDSGVDTDKHEIYCPRIGFNDDAAHARGIMATTCIKTGIVDNLVAAAEELGEEVGGIDLDGLIKTDGVKILGTPIGTEEYIASMLRERLCTYPRFMERIVLMSAANVIAILRACMLPTVTNLLRTINPTLMQPHAHRFDNIVRTAYNAIIEDN